MTLGWNPRCGAIDATRRATGEVLIFGELDDLDGAGAMRQAANEAPFDERRDQAMDAGLRAQIERVLHFVERGRYAALLHAPVDEKEQVFLFFGEHRFCLKPLWLTLGGTQAWRSTCPQA